LARPQLVHSEGWPHETNPFASSSSPCAPSRVGGLRTQGRILSAGPVTTTLPHMGFDRYGASIGRSCIRHHTRRYGDGSSAASCSVNRRRERSLVDRLFPTLGGRRQLPLPLLLLLARATLLDRPFSRHLRHRLLSLGTHQALPLCRCVQCPRGSQPATAAAGSCGSRTRERRTSP